MDGVVRRARVEVNPIGVVVVVATPRDDDLLALHPDATTLRVAALDVLDHIGLPSSHPNIPRGVELAADRKTARSVAPRVTAARSDLEVADEAKGR